MIKFSRYLVTVVLMVVALWSIGLWNNGAALPGGKKVVIGCWVQ